MSILKVEDIAFARLRAPDLDDLERLAKSGLGAIEAVCEAEA